MELVEDIQAAVAQLKLDIVAEKAEVQAKIAALSQQITDLQAQVAAGSAATPEQLQAILASLTEIDAGVKDISEPTTPPTV